MIRHLLRNTLFAPSPLRNQQKRMDLDWVLVCCALAVMAIGLVMSASASPYVAIANDLAPMHYFSRHATYVIGGILLICLVLKLPLDFWQRYSWQLLGLAALLLVLVYLPVIGYGAKGSRRWVNLVVFRLQASEVAKLAMVVFIAGYLVRHHEALKTRPLGFVKPLGLLAIFAVLVLFEPDFGALTVMVGSIIVMMFLAGTTLKVAVPVLIGSIPLVLLGFWLEDYRVQRLRTLWDPWSDQFDQGYQVTQALISFGRGEYFGMGLGNGIQKLFFLPEAHTDFVFSVIAEELGLTGALVTLCLLIFICWRMFRIGIRAENTGEYFKAFVAYGIGAIWFGQVFINVGVNLNILPTKGLTLPFISYGGSSMLLCCAELAIVLRIEWEVRQKLLREQGGAVVLSGRREPFVSTLEAGHGR